MSNNPLVSIIIPTYNRGHIIMETLESVVAQTYPHFECIIVDDGSTDNTQVILTQLLEKDNRFKLLKRPDTKKKGPSSCRNYGITQSKGDYIIFLDSDDLLLPFCLEQRVHFMKANPENAFFVVPMILRDRGGNDKVKEIPNCSNYLTEFLSYKLHWGVMCTTWKRDVLIELNGFNELYANLEDPELHIRAMIHYENQYYVGHNYPADSVYRYFADVKNMSLMGVNFHQSLMLFLPNVVGLLIDKNEIILVAKLKSYLLQYFYAYDKFLGLRNNIKLLELARSLKVLTLKEFLIQKYIICIERCFGFFQDKTRKIRINFLQKRI